MYKWFNINERTPLCEIASSHMSIVHNYSLHNSLFCERRHTAATVYESSGRKERVATWSEYFSNAEVRTNLPQEPQPTYDVMIDHDWNVNESMLMHNVKYLMKGGYYVIENIPNANVAMYRHLIVQWENKLSDMDFWLVEMTCNFLVVHEKSLDISDSPLHIPDTSYGKALLQNWNHVQKLNHYMNKTILQWYGCGSYMCDGASTIYQSSYFEKQEILYEAACASQNILELGVHGGHSLLICLIANPHAHINAVDICYWVHTAQCVAYLQDAFPSSKITLHQQSSQSFVKDFSISSFWQPDLVHMDGDHAYDVVYNDTLEVLGSHPKIMVFDDYDSAGGRPVLADLQIPVLRASNTPYRNCIVHFQGTQATLMVTAYFKLDRDFANTEYLHYQHDSYITHACNLFRSTPLIQWAFFTNCAEVFEGKFPNVVVYDTVLTEIAGDLLGDLRLPDCRNEEKDTLQYMAVQNMKFHLVTTALDKNPEYNGAAWLDSGTMMHAPNSEKQYAQLLLRVSQSKPTHLFIPGFHRMLGPQGLHNGPIWTFAGSFFVGDRQSLDDFNKESWDALLQCVGEGRLTWELNIWHEVYQNPKWSHIFCHATDHTLTPMAAYLDAM